MWNSQSKQWKKPSNFKIELLNHNVNMIMESQLLLDEDQEIITTHWSPLAIEVPRNHSKWVNSVISLSGTAMGIGLKSWPLAVASCIPMAIITIYDCYNGLSLRKHKTGFKKLIFLLNEQYNLIHLMCEHFQKRTNALAALSAQLKSRFMLMLIRRQEKEFADHAAHSILQICLEIQKNLLDISTNLDVEGTTYSAMCNWDLESFLQVKVGRPFFQLRDTSILKAFDYFSQFFDTYRLLMSSFLGCVALSMSINIWRDADKFNSLLYNNIPKMSKVLEKHLSQTKDCFNNLQYCLIEESKVSLSPKKPYFDNFAKHSVFLKPLADCIRNIQLTYDITRSLRQKIIDSKEPNATDMNAILEDILKRNRFTSESIEIVIKMNNIVAGKAERLPIITPHSSETETVKDSVEVLKSIHHDDPNDVPEDEEYSLSPWESDESEEFDAQDKSSDQSLHVDELLMCVKSQKMLIEELRGKLRLIREKKLMPIDEECHKKKNVSSGDDLGNAPSTSCTIPQPSSVSVLRPPPPPPIVNFQQSMPELSGTTTGHLKYGYTGGYNYANTISSIAKTLNRPEETYGSSDSSENESEEEIRFLDGVAEEEEEK